MKYVNLLGYAKLLLSVLWNSQWFSDMSATVNIGLHWSISQKVAHCVSINTEYALYSGRGWISGVGKCDPDFTLHFHFSRANLLLSSNSEIPLWDETEIELWKPQLKSTKLQVNLCLNTRLSSSLIISYGWGGGCMCTESGMAS